MLLGRLVRRHLQRMGGCTAANPGDPCGTCKTCNSSGQCVPVANGTSCEGTLFCVSGETCQAGVCTGGTPIDCADSDPCTNDACNEAIKQCVHTPLSDGTPCSSGDPCVVAACQGGTCTPTGAVACDAGVPTDGSTQKPTRAAGAIPGAQSDAGGQDDASGAEAGGHADGPQPGQDAGTGGGRAAAPAAQRPAPRERVSAAPRVRRGVAAARWRR